ncbi:MAG TPA: TonB family protein [Pyrinomonadaceae bacterium]|jgi:protein TonB
MLDQLVESKNTSAENTRRSEFILGTLVILVTVLVGSWVYSLFNKEYGMGTGDLDISSLVAPVALPEDAPPPPPEEPEKQPEQKSAPNPDKPTVVEKIATMEETTEPPKELKGEVLKAPPLKKSEASNYNVGDQNQGRFVEGQKYNEGPPTGLNVGGTGGGGNDDEGDAPVVVKKTPTPEPKETPKPAPKTISGGVVNGKATNLVKPPYPAAARAVRAAGAVNVQVTIDENGNVISASAVSGHPLLRAAAVSAARSSKFSPTMLSGQAVKVTGVIVYNFVP